MEVAKEVGTEIAVNIAKKAKTNILKTYEQSKEKITTYLVEEKKRIEEELKEELKEEEEEKKPMKKSFFSRALKWTKEIAKDIAEEYQRESTSTSIPVSTEVDKPSEEYTNKDLQTTTTTTSTSTSTSPMNDNDNTIITSNPEENATKPVEQPVINTEKEQQEEQE